MEDWKLRVISEKEELDERIARLEFFIQDNPLRGQRFDRLPLGEQGRLTAQLHTMVQLSAILGERIRHFT